MLHRTQLLFALLLRTKRTMSFSASSTASSFTTKSSELVAPDPPAGDGWQPVFNEANVLMQTPARMLYVSPATVKATNKRDPGGSDSVIEGAVWKEQNLFIANGRASTTKHLLHPNGFELLPNDPISEDIDFLAKDDVLDNYYPHCQALLQKYLGEGVQVYAFDHNIRRQVKGNTQSPIALVHGDYTTTSAPRRLQLLAESPKINDIWRERLGEEPLLKQKMVDDCVAGKRRFCLINVWRNIDSEHPVQSLPLACVDSKTVNTESDLRTLELVYDDRIGENFLVCPTPEHQWVYFPQMRYNEALLIKQWDSEGDFAMGRDSLDTSTMSIHSAFKDPTTPTGAAPRQSIEVRCVAIWPVSSS